MEELPVRELGLILLIPLAAAYLLRRPLSRMLADPAPPARRPARQFMIDFALLSGASLLMAVYNLAAFDFPFVQSGLKLVIGFSTLAIFTGTDLALERERAVILEAMDNGFDRMPPRVLFPLTRKFLLTAGFITVMTTAVLLMVILRDFKWPAATGISADSVSAGTRSVTIEILFVMGVLLAELLNLILSWSRNLKLLFDNQTTVLKQVGTGDLTGAVPAVTTDEFGFIAGHTNLMIDGLRDRSRLAEGMAAAREIQLNLLPAHAPVLPGLDATGISISSDETGGDYYDFLTSDTDRTMAALVGDVTGHGVGAALLMAAARAFLRLRTTLPGTLPQALKDVNRQLHLDTRGSGRFMTLFLLVVDLKTMNLAWISAGHDPALTYDPASGTFGELRGEGLPLGVLEETDFKEFSRSPLTPGEIVLMGTDGIWETRNPEGEMFGKKRVEQLLEKHHEKTASELAGLVTNAVSDFRGDAPQADDLTLVIIKRTEDA